MSRFGSSTTMTPGSIRTTPASARTRRARLHEQGALFLAGPWDDDSGALLVFTVDRAGVDRIMVGDPYFTTSGVDVVSVRTWRPVLGPGAAGHQAIGA